MKTCPCEVLRWLAHRLGYCTVTCHGRAECSPWLAGRRQAPGWFDELVLDLDELWHERRWPMRWRP